MIRSLLHTIYFFGFVVTSLQAWMFALPSSSFSHLLSKNNLKSSNSRNRRRMVILNENNNNNINSDSTKESDGSGGGTYDDDESSVPRNITDLAEKKVRLAKVQAEIDRILNCPIDPPFDAESELKKVVSISPPLIAEGSSEYAYEEQVSHMEAELYKAVKKQDYARASEQQRAISQLHVDDCGLVLQANSKFYDAFSKKDHNAMEAVWLQDRSCVCIHPSHKPMVGARDIMKSWGKMFQSSNGSFQRNWMEPHEIRMSVKATMAVVTCEEHVYTRRFVRGQKRKTELVNKLTATNIFRKVGGKWYMSYHHSSWHADSEAAKNALKGGSTTKGKSTNKRQMNSNGIDSDNDNYDDEGESSGIDNILGLNNFGPVLGDSQSDSSNNGEGGPQKRVIMGSLSDLLSGNLGDLLGGEEGSSNNKGGGDIGDLFDSGIGEGGAIIQFQKIDDDDDDDDEDDDEENNNGADGDAMLKQWAKSGSENPKKAKDSLRQNCIATLRKLATEGRISQKQKRTLLTDIINCSAKGEFSMVEVAYELLCTEGGDADDAEEEFADQCRVFAE